HRAARGTGDRAGHARRGACRHAGERGLSRQGARLNALEVRDLHAYYGASHVLQGVSLDVPEGGAVALVGRNGAGKTTTIAAIVGFTRPRSGSVHVAGREMTGRTPHVVAAAG